MHVWYIGSVCVSVTGPRPCTERQEMWEQGVVTRVNICALFLDKTGVISVLCAYFDRLHRIVQRECLPKARLRVRGPQRSDSAGMAPGSCSGGISLGVRNFYSKEFDFCKREADHIEL